MFFKLGKLIILSMQFVDRERCVTLTRVLSEESIFSIGGVMHSSLMTVASSGTAPSFFSDHMDIAFAQVVPGIADRMKSKNFNNLLLYVGMSIQQSGPMI